ncbi:hypothetical protein ACDA63_18900 [Uliginosibacterium sp. sgz301328]|uniref:hypothetical protein n=1 Tax=Uliginosibacterium sp. sgz301328 TaxID=3243764 RepID=UPI00359CEC8C
MGDGAPPRLLDELDALELLVLDALLELPALLLLELAPLLCDDDEAEELIDERDELAEAGAELLLSSPPPQADRTAAAVRLSSHGKAARIKLGVCMSFVS